MKIMLSIALFSLQGDYVFVPENCGLRIADCGFKDFYQFYKKWQSEAIQQNPRSEVRNPKFKWDA